MVVEQFGVQAQERPAQVGAAQPLEVHREERDVGEHVTHPQALVELQAVQDARPVVEAVDVVGEQVTVPVACPTGVDALIEQRLASATEPICGRQHRPAAREHVGAS